MKKIIIFFTIFLGCILAKGADVLFLRNQKGFDVYEFKQDKIQPIKHKPIILADSFHYASAIKNGLLIVVANNKSIINYEKRKLDGYDLRYVFMPQHYLQKIVVSPKGNYIAVFEKQNNKLTIYQWGNQNAIFSVDFKTNLSNGIISDDEKYLITWIQDWKNLQYKIRIFDIVEKKLDADFSINALMGYSQLFPLQVKYCKEKFLFNTIGASYVYTEKNGKSKINMIEYHEMTQNYFINQQIIYNVINKKNIPILNFKKYLTEKQFVSKFSISQSKKYICANVGLDIYIFDLENKQKLLLQKNAFNSFNDYFYWSR